MAKKKMSLGLQRASAASESACEVRDVPELHGDVDRLAEIVGLLDALKGEAEMIKVKLRDMVIEDHDSALLSGNEPQKSVTFVSQGASATVTVANRFQDLKASFADDLREALGEDFDSVCRAKLELKTKLALPELVAELKLSKAQQERLKGACQLTEKLAINGAAVHEALRSCGAAGRDTSALEEIVCASRIAPTVKVK